MQSSFTALAPDRPRGVWLPPSFETRDMPFSMTAFIPNNCGRTFLQYDRISS
jgi:hypothetical protein